MIFEGVFRVQLAWATMVLPCASYLIDILVLQARMLPRILYILPAAIILILYSFIDILLSFLPANKLSRVAETNPILFIVIHLALMFGCIILSCGALGLTRIQNCCYPKTSSVNNQ